VLNLEQQRQCVAAADTLALCYRTGEGFPRQAAADLLAIIASLVARLEAEAEPGLSEGSPVDGEPMTWERIRREHSMALAELRAANKEVLSHLDAHVEWMEEAFAAMAPEGPQEASETECPGGPHPPEWGCLRCGIETPAPSLKAGEQ